MPLPSIRRRFRSSAGALTAIPVCRVGSIRNTLKALQAEGHSGGRCYGKKPQAALRRDFRKPTALVMGAEDTGISKEVLKLMTNSWRSR
ncbi:MAG: TrmH family RNA methyltransferase [Alistipes putredinis]